MSYTNFDANRLKHLELIQAVISRLAGNSFVVKGWAITVAAAFFGFALSGDSARLAGAALVPIIAFWILDTYFLRSERLFRALYDEVRLSDQRVEPFSMGATGSAFVQRVRAGATACDNKKAASWFRAAFSLTLALVYLGLIMATGTVAAFAHHHAAAPRPHKRCHALPQASRMRSAIPPSKDSFS